MTHAPDDPETLAAGLAARLLHDMAGPLSGVINGLELMSEGGDPVDREAAEDLTRTSAQAMLDLLDFCRVAFGADRDPRGPQAMARLAAAPFSGRRATLDWTCACDPLDGVGAQAALILAQIAASGLGAGGVARISADLLAGRLRVTADGEGRRAGPAPEAIAGLRGLPAPAGAVGRWAPARYLHGLVAAAEGTLTVSTRDGGFTLVADLPFAKP